MLDKDVKVLMVATQEIVDDISDGGKRVSNRNYELLKRVFGEEKVTLIMYTNNTTDKQCNNIIRLAAYSNLFERCINILSGRLFTSKKNEDWLVEYIAKNSFDLIFLDRSLYGNLVKKIERRNLTCMIWTFTHNVEFNYFKSKFRKKRLLGNIICNVVKKSEQRTFQCSDFIMTLTDRDTLLISQLYEIQSIYVIPTSFADRYDERKYSRNGKLGKDLLFIGSMFGPNYDGIKWFVENVMTELPECNLKIVGKGFEKKKKELNKSNVEVIGSVDDLEEYYYQNNIMVMPIFYGDGQKVKTAEAMMYGKVILATDEALEGYSVQGIEGIYRCNTKEEFINKLKEIRSYDENVLSTNVRQLFQNNYDFESIVKRCSMDFYKVIEQRK